MATRDQPNLAAIAVAAQRVAQADRELAEVVRTARESGATWQQIGDVLGVTRQAAFKRFGHSLDPTTGLPISGQLVDLHRAAELFELLAAGELGELRAQMTEACARALPARSILEIWRDILADVGELEQCTDPQARTPDGEVLPEAAQVRCPVVLRVLLQHEAGTMAGHVSLNRAGKINGLVIGREGAESSLPF